MKKIFLIPLAAILAFAAGCNEEIGNPDEVLAGTGEITNVLMRTADVKAEVYGAGITARGVVYATVENPTLGDSYVTDSKSGAGIFTLSLEGLTPETTYYVRSFANYGDETVYGSSRSFRTKKDLIPEVKTTFIESTQIELRAVVEGGDDAWVVTERGIAYGLTTAPTVEDNKVSVAVEEDTDGRGSFVAYATGLTTNTAYYVRPYCVTEATGVVYGDETRLTTLASQSAAIFEDALEVAGLSYGVFRQTDEKQTFAMHYAFDGDTNEITITYFDGRDAKHETLSVTYNSTFTQMNWTSVTVGEVSVSGFRRNGTSISLVGTENAALSEPMPASDIYAMFVHTDYGGINRISELRPADGQSAALDGVWERPANHQALEKIEINGEISAIVGCPSPNTHGYYYLRNELDGTGKPTITVTDDRIQFTRGDYYTGYSWGMTDSGARAEMEVLLQSFFDLWYTPGGVIVVRESGNSPAVKGGAGTGGFYYYVISPATDSWAKLWLRAWGQ